MFFMFYYTILLFKTLEVTDEVFIGAKKMHSKFNVRKVFIKLKGS